MKTLFKIIAEALPLQNPVPNQLPPNQNIRGREDIEKQLKEKIRLLRQQLHDAEQALMALPAKPSYKTNFRF